MNKYYTLLLVLLCMSGYCSAETIKTINIEIIKKHVKDEDTDTLVVFDVDDVLMHPYDQILQMQNKAYLEGLQRELEKRIGSKNAETLYSIIFLERQNGPVDDRMRDLIINLQSKQISVLALTNCFTGTFGNIPSMEDWRLSELSRLGYHFEKSWSDVPPTVFSDLVPSGRDQSFGNSPLPMFKDGVVFTSAVSKGKALKAFLLHVRRLPKLIIFIDDKKKHLASVEKMAKSLGIRFIGIEYTAIAEAKAQSQALNETRAQTQFKILEKEQEWLSDAKVDERLTQQK